MITVKVTTEIHTPTYDERGFAWEFDSEEIETYTFVDQDRADFFMTQTDTHGMIEEPEPDEWPAYAEIRRCEVI